MSSLPIRYRRRRLRAAGGRLLEGVQGGGRLSMFRSALGYVREAGLRAFPYAAAIERKEAAYKAAHSATHPADKTFHLLEAGRQLREAKDLGKEITRSWPPNLP